MQFEEGKQYCIFIKERKSLEDLANPEGAKFYACVDGETVNRSWRKTVEEMIRPFDEDGESNGMECKVLPGDTHGMWIVEAVCWDGEGELFRTEFYGADAESRAREYAAWKYGN